MSVGGRVVVDDPVQARLAAGETCVYRTPLIAYLALGALMIYPTWQSVFGPVSAQDAIDMVPWAVATSPLWLVLIALWRQRLEIGPDRLRYRPIVDTDRVFSFAYKEVALSDVRACRTEFSPDGWGLAFSDAKGTVLLRVGVLLSGFLVVRRWAQSRFGTGSSAG